SAPSMALAAPCVLPTTFGTATVGGALATTSVTVEPLAAALPPTGSWLITVPGVVAVETWKVVSTLKPRLWSVDLACPASSVVTSGTCTDGGPLETKIVTGVPTDGWAPAAGLVSITCPLTYWALVWCTTLPTFRLAIWIEDLACWSVSPTTVGTVVLPGPEETVSDTFEPSLALIPASGFWPITVPDGLELVTCSWLTVKPLPCSCDCAAVNGSPTTPGTTSLTGRRSR